MGHQTWQEQPCQDLSPASQETADPLLWAGPQNTLAVSPPSTSMAPLPEEVTTTGSFYYRSHGMFNIEVT